MAASTIPLGRPYSDRPLAAAGYVSYRYPGYYPGWIMIGAKDHDDALNEANRSLTKNGGAAEMARLQVWDGTQYVPAKEG